MELLPIRPGGLMFSKRIPFSVQEPRSVGDVRADMARTNVTILFKYSLMGLALSF